MTTRHNPDNSILRFAHPLKFGLMGIAIYSILFLFSPLVVDIEFSIGGIIYIVLGYLAFFAGGCFTSIIPRKSTKKATTLTLDVPRLFRFVSAAAILGLGLRIIDRFFIRNVSLAQSVMERREALESGGSNLFSTFSAALYPFSLLTFFCYFLLCRSDGKHHPVALIVTILTFFLPSLDATMLGSRSTILMSVSLLFLYLLYFRVLRFKPSHLIVVTLSGVLLFLFSSWIFMDRLSVMGIDILFSILQSGYAFTLQPKTWIVNFLSDTTSNLAHIATFTYLNVSQYFLHGLFEFLYLYDNFNWTYSHSWGSNTFFVAFKLIAQLFGEGLSTDYLIELQPRSGVYTTFFGPIFVDFGWFGLIPIFIFGLVSSLIWRSSLNGDILAIPPLFYLNIIIIFMPIVNLIQSAGGVYVLGAFAAYYWLSKRLFLRHYDA